MLKHVPKQFTPELLRLIMEMGHGERILISDANYPWRSMKCEHVHVPVEHIDVLLEDILYYFPVDQTQSDAVLTMESAVESGAFEKYRKLLARDEPSVTLKTLRRFDFYDCASGAVGVVVTADTTKGGNILITKGVVRE